jgi:hypothetical protein
MSRELSVVGYCVHLNISAELHLSEKVRYCMLDTHVIPDFYAIMRLHYGHFSVHITCMVFNSLLYLLMT